MNLLENWVQTPAANALVWTLIHSLWEGALVALVLAAALSVFRGSRARYAAACLALVCLLAGFGLTFANLMARQPALALRTGPLRLPPLELDSTASAGLHAARTLADDLPWLAPFWIAGVLIFHVRSLAGWIGARRLRRRGVCTAPDAWQGRLAQLAARLRIAAPVTLWESALAEVPLVIGCIRPMILMPVGLLAGLPAAQVESLLLHELAHIRRYDYLVNLLQVFVEGLVFYHPAVWWIAAVIRAERENCCDDLVVATQGDAFQYASALAALEFSRGADREPALAATGGNLVKRIRRLLAQPETPRSALTPLLSAAVLTVTSVAVLAAWQTKPAAKPEPVTGPAPAPVAAPAPSPKPKLLAQAAPAPQAQRETDVRPMTDVERQRREEKLRAELESPYRKWLNQDVAYIISDAERTAFKALTTDEEREHFIEQFWLRRDPTPGSPANEMKEEHYRRIGYANDHFAAGIPGWKTDRGRIYITYGPPDEKESHPSGSAADPVPNEQWLYHLIAGVGRNIIVEFVDPAGNGEFHMTSDPSVAPFNFGPATVQVFAGKAVISMPVPGLRDHPFTITGRIQTKNGSLVATFEDTVDGPATNYVKTVPVPLGEYQVNVTVRDPKTSKSFSQSISFQAK